MIKPAPRKPEKRRQQLIYLLPALKIRIDNRRHELGQSRSEWIERAIVRELERQKA
ncbi:MAG: ribbon-helix-helix protein, CopG family [Patescibacteria group bacterium]|nr:ribbon-helix-helix protein, CopG family [Patescibacteria group bacterium]